jgi:hypothetical protein
MARQHRGAREIHLEVRHAELLLERISFALRLDQAKPRWNEA